MATLELALPEERADCGAWLQKHPPAVVATLLDAVELLYMGLLRASESEGCRAAAELQDVRGQLRELEGLRAEAIAAAPRLARQAWLDEENNRLRAELSATTEAQQQLRLRLSGAQQELMRLLEAAQPLPRPQTPFLRREASPASSRRSLQETWPAAARRPAASRRRSGLRRQE